jgi:hypothetical protein
MIYLYISKRMNRFYNLPILAQWSLAVLLTLTGFVPVFGVIVLSEVHPAFFSLLLVCVPVGQFTMTPISKLSGTYTYYSPMLLGYMANQKNIDLHNGSSFDYWMVMRKTKPGILFRNQILKYHLEGLLNIIKQMEEGKIPETVKIEGTSYFFSARTMQKMGFEMKSPTLFYRFNLLTNFIDLCWMYSLSKGKFTIPKVWLAKRSQISGKQLMAHQPIIQGLFKRLNRE